MNITINIVLIFMKIIIKLVIIKTFDLFKIANVLTNFVSSNFVVNVSFDFLNLFFDKRFSICKRENY